VSYKSHVVPVLAIVTKFDDFVRNILQDLEENAEGEEEISEEELEENALRTAESIADTHYTKPLMNLPYPPREVVYLSESKYVCDVVKAGIYLVSTVSSSLGHCCQQTTRGID
jgi:hypothetical protein